MKILVRSIIFFLGLFLLFACTNAPYKNAVKTLEDEQYKEAITQFDNYITTTKHPAFREKAKDDRSEAYYQLGVQEYQLNNFYEASEFFYLSNSNKSDSLLDNCYYQLARQALNDAQYLTTYEYLSFIMYHLEDSDLMPDVLFNKLVVEYEYANDIDLAYTTYHTIQDEYPHSEAFDKATLIVDEFLPEIIVRAKQIWQSNDYNEALTQLFLLHEYPASYQNTIEELIGNVYYSWAVVLLDERDLENVQEYLLNAVAYNENLESQADKKLTELANIYINRGDEFVNERDIDEGIVYYEKSLTIIPDFQIALNRISRAQEIAQRIEQAEQLVAQGDNQFDNEEYVAAYDSYSEAYKLDSIPSIYEKINRAYVWTRITTDPEQYAIELVKQYDKNVIVSKINELEALAQKNFSRQDIRVTPWQVFRSVTKNSYEVRYTLVIPETNYFFRWLVRLETGEVIPLNDITEEIFSS